MSFLGSLALPKTNDDGLHVTNVAQTFDFYVNETTCKFLSNSGFIQQDYPKIHFFAMLILLHAK